MTRFKFKPIYVAVFLCALAVIALWQPYWHIETNKVQVRIAETSTSYPTEKEAFNAIKNITAITASGVSDLVSGAFAEKRGEEWYNTDGIPPFDIGFREKWVGVLYRYENVADGIGLDYYLGIPKLLIIAFFIGTILLMILWDSRIKKKEEEP